MSSRWFPLSALAAFCLACGGSDEGAPGDAVDGVPDASTLGGATAGGTAAGGGAGAGACPATEPSCQPGGGTGGGGAGSGGRGSGAAGSGAAGTGAAGTGGAGGKGGPRDAGSEDAYVTSSDAAPSGSHAVDAVFVLLDQSGSMVSLWPGVVGELTAFANDPASAGLNFGIALFPATGTALVDCTGAAYDEPDIGWVRLGEPDDAGDGGVVGQTLASTVPFGLGTPLAGAVRGAIAGCESYQLTHPGASCGAVVITDGLPTACEDDAGALGAVAAASSASVPLYFVGLTVDAFAFVDNVAVATGSDCQLASPKYACDTVASALERVRDIAP